MMLLTTKTTRATFKKRTTYEEDNVTSVAVLLPLMTQTYCATKVLEISLNMSTHQRTVVCIVVTRLFSLVHILYFVYVLTT